MKLLIFALFTLFSFNSFAQRMSDKYNGMVCEISGNDHREHFEKFEIVPTGEPKTFKIIHTPQYYVDFEEPMPVTLPGKFKASYIPKEDPRIIELRNGYEGTFEKQNGKFFDVFESKEVTTKTPGCCGDYFMKTINLEIKIRRFFDPDGPEPHFEISEHGLELSYHPSFCKAIIKD